MNRILLDRAHCPLMLLEDYTGSVCLLHKLTPTYPDYREILVDTADFELLARWQWSLVYVGEPRELRVVRCGDKQLLHRVVMAAPKGLMVDHIYHNPLDNRRKRLRICTGQQNVHNNRPKRTAKSKYKGVCWDKKRSKWVVNCGRGTENPFFATFDCELQAARAYNEFARVAYGEFAYQNRV